MTASVDTPMAWLVVHPGYSGRNPRPTEVPRPPGLWLTYSDLWEGYKVSRGLLDREVGMGRVHYYSQEGATYYRWEDVREHLADLVEQALLGGGDGVEEFAG